MTPCGCLNMSDVESSVESDSAGSLASPARSRSPALRPSTTRAGTAGTQASKPPLDTQPPPVKGPSLVLDEESDSSSLVVASKWVKKARPNPRRRKAQASTPEEAWRRARYRTETTRVLQPGSNPDFSARCAMGTKARVVSETDAQTANKPATEAQRGCTRR